MKFYKPPLKSLMRAERVLEEKKKGGVGMAKDPVCGMEVSQTTAKFKLERGGTTYYFCSRECFEKFKKRK
ncbi:MAG: YHS domain-containing protein [Candidatus Micrarchaeia archaeon]